MLAPPQCLQLLLMRLCQQCWPPQSLHSPLRRLCSKMPDPPQSLALAPLAVMLADTSAPSPCICSRCGYARRYVLVGSGLDDRLSTVIQRADEPLQGCMQARKRSVVIARHRETHHPIYSDPTELQVHGNASGPAVLALARTFLLRSRCIGRTALAGLTLICPLLAGLTLICPLLEGSRVRHHHQAPRNAAPNACAAPKGCRTRSKCPI